VGGPPVWGLGGGPSPPPSTVKFNACYETLHTASAVVTAVIHRRVLAPRSFGWLVGCSVDRLAG
jgi:hypothetical protein